MRFRCREEGMTFMELDSDRACALRLISHRSSGVKTLRVRLSLGSCCSRTLNRSSSLWYSPGLARTCLTDILSIDSFIRFEHFYRSDSLSSFGLRDFQLAFSSWHSQRQTRSLHLTCVSFDSHSRFEHFRSFGSCFDFDIRRFCLAPLTCLSQLLAHFALVLFSGDSSCRGGGRRPDT